MGSIFAYSITSSILLMAMYLIYKLVLAGENQHGYNRVILWAIYLCSLSLPLLLPSVSEWFSASASANTPNIIIESGTPLTEFTIEEKTAPLVPHIMLGVYLSGVVFAVALTITIAIKLTRTIRSGRRQRIGNHTLIIIPDAHIAPFSWLNFIVMSQEDYNTSADVIIAHESRHLELKHWFDLLVAQLIAILQWFNPAAWLMREELKTIHEYQADAAVIASGANIKEYQLLLIKKAVGARFPSLANSLNHSKLKKRVTMMYKTKTSVGRRLRALAIIPAGMLAIVAINTPVVASVISNASEASISLDVADKNTKISNDTQAPKLKGKVVGISGNDTDKLPVYVNGEKQDASFDVNSIQPGNIASVAINKGGDKPGVYVTLKDSKANNSGITVNDANNSKTLKLKGKTVGISGNGTNKLPVYVNGEKQDASFDINSIQPGNIASVSINKDGDKAGIYVTLKDSKTTAE